MVVLEAVQQDGCALEDVLLEELKGDAEVVARAIASEQPDAFNPFIVEQIPYASRALIDLVARVMWGLENERKR